MGHLLGTKLNGNDRLGAGGREIWVDNATGN